mmetsp:Transcript_3335/g.5775  ORF Transcript_3335/g.5775 Transcript_3335/m.5775 type:complete len:202 (+) Transcript_3335:1049-1654(+)
MGAKNGHAHATAKQPQDCRSCQQRRQQVPPPPCGGFFGDCGQGRGACGGGGRAGPPLGHQVRPEGQVRRSASRDDPQTGSRVQRARHQAQAARDLGRTPRLCVDCGGGEEERVRGAGSQVSAAAVAVESKRSPPSKRWRRRKGWCCCLSRESAPPQTGPSARAHRAPCRSTVSVKAEARSCKARAAGGHPGGSPAHPPSAC